ncbi:hypothetical protein [Streptomyces sp. NPDC002553]|uniref:hypothetical protein n=1 Tax=Streptomyces sp. NPDC002553 TaxID=3154417 RepID=UPI00331DC938
MGPNVAQLVKVERARRKRPEPWSVEEACSFLESAQLRHDYLYCAYALILALGLRKGEVLGLTCASLLAALDVHPRIAMQILRHSEIAVTTEVSNHVPSADTRRALRKLGKALGGGSKQKKEGQGKKGKRKQQKRAEEQTAEDGRQES